MITLKDYLEAINFKVTDGSDFSWDCFGPNARYLDSNDRSDANGRYSINAIFDAEDQTIYSLEAWDYERNKEYRWMHPDFKSKYNAEAVEKEIDPDESFDNNKYIDLEVPEDILEKINALVNNEDYDTRIKIPIDFSDKELLKYMKLAHEMDITFNELMTRSLKEAIEEHKRDPEAFKLKAERFLNENSGSE